MTPVRIFIALLLAFVLSAVEARAQLTPDGFALPSPLTGNEIVSCQLFASPYITTCTTQQIAALAGHGGTIFAGTPTAGQVPIASGPLLATWGTLSSLGGVAFSGVPSAGQVPIASGPAGAVWGPVFTSAASNTALSALPSTYAANVTRVGFAVVGDSPPIVYTPSGGACSLNAGAGDGGAQVPTSDGKCWIADLPSPAPITIWGAKGDGTTNNSAAIQAALNWIGNPGTGAAGKAGGIISVPIDGFGGVYHYLTPLTLTVPNSPALAKNVGLVGPGTLQPATGMAGSALTVAGNTGSPYTEKIEGIYFDFGSNSGLTCGLELKGTANMDVYKNGFNIDGGSFKANFAPLCVTSLLAGNDNTSSFWTSIRTNVFRKFAGVGTRGSAAYCIAIYGPANATQINDLNLFNGCSVAVVNIPDPVNGEIANGVGISNNDFELSLNPITGSTAAATSIPLGTGNKTFTLVTPSAGLGLGFAPGQHVLLTDTGTDKMSGTVVSYTGAVLVVNVSSVFGTGTPSTTWTATAAKSSGILLLGNPEVVISSASYAAGTITMTIDRSAGPGFAPGDTFNILSAATVTGSGCEALGGGLAYTVASVTPGSPTATFTPYTVTLSPVVGGSCLTFTGLALWGNGLPTGWNIHGNRLENIAGSFVTITSTDEIAGPFNPPSVIPYMHDNYVAGTVTNYILVPFSSSYSSFESFAAGGGSYVGANNMYFNGGGLSWAVGGKGFGVAASTGSGWLDTTYGQAGTYIGQDSSQRPSLKLDTGGNAYVCRVDPAGMPANALACYYNGSAVLSIGPTSTNSAVPFSIGAGAAITSSGAGGALGTNAFTSTAYAPLASPQFSGTVGIGVAPNVATFQIGGVTAPTTAGLSALQYLTGNLGSAATIQAGTIHDTVQVDATGAVATAAIIAMRFAMSKSGGGVVSNAASIYIDAAATETIGANNWAILSNSTAASKFAGSIGATLASASGTSTVCNTAGSGTALTLVASGTACASSAEWTKDLHPPEPLNPAGLDHLRTDIPWSYRKDSGIYEDGKIHVGLFADDVERMDPRCVVHDQDGRLLNYYDRCVIAYLVADRNNLRDRLEALEKR